MKVIDELGERLRFIHHKTQEYLKEVEEYLGASGKRWSDHDMSHPRKIVVQREASLRLLPQRWLLPVGSSMLLLDIYYCQASAGHSPRHLTATHGPRNVTLLQVRDDIIHDSEAVLERISTGRPKLCPPHLHWRPFWGVPDTCPALFFAPSTATPPKLTGQVMNLKIFYTNYLCSR